MVLRDASSSPESWSDKTSWRPSRAPGGSPGEDDTGGGRPRGWQQPGDVNQDGSVNLTDAVNLLGILFDALPPSLPCAGDEINEGGNRTVHDINGDGSLNITDPVVLLGFLFGKGAPPARGTECVPFDGCPDICVP